MSEPYEYFTTYLLYENTNGTPTWLVGSYTSSDTSNTSSDLNSSLYWEWIDLTEQLTLFDPSSLQSQTIIPGPQSMGIMKSLTADIGANYSITLVLNDDRPKDISITFAYALGPSNAGGANMSEIMYKMYNDTSLQVCKSWLC